MNRKNTTAMEYALLRTYTCTYCSRSNLPRQSAVYIYLYMYNNNLLVPAIGIQQRVEEAVEGNPSQGFRLSSDLSDCSVKVLNP